MVFAKIENYICTNILEFDTEESAYNFDKGLVLVEEGFGIGDTYKDDTWQKHQNTEKEIKLRLIKLDNTINRATEDLYALTNVKPYESVEKAINLKIELRNELKKISKGEM